MSTTSLTTTPTVRSVRRAGVWCLGGGLLGGAQAAIMLAWPPQVSGDLFSYPFGEVEYVVAELSFFVQHLLLVLGVAALLRLPAVRVARTARIATTAAAVGLVLLALNELVAISAYDAATDSDHVRLVENLFGPPVMLIGVGLLVAGATLLRRGTISWSGARWVPAIVLALGVYVFVPLTPAISGSFTAGRLGIGGWMLLFAVLGYGLTRLEDRDV